MNIYTTSNFPWADVLMYMLSFTTVQSHALPLSHRRSHKSTFTVTPDAMLNISGFDCIPGAVAMLGPSRPRPLPPDF